MLYLVPSSMGQYAGVMADLQEGNMVVYMLFSREKSSASGKKMIPMSSITYFVLVATRPGYPLNRDDVHYSIQAPGLVAIEGKRLKDDYYSMCKPLLTEIGEEIQSFTEVDNHDDEFK
jgi:hypothetical protein